VILWRGGSLINGASASSPGFPRAHGSQELQDRSLFLLDILISGQAWRIIQRKAESTLKVQFRTRELQRCAQEESFAYREWGHDVGRVYLRRIATIRNVSEFRKLFDIVSLRLHPLTGDRQSSYALTLRGRWRLIVAVEGDTAIIEEVSNHYGD
jgi:plasmid maintenance system killer protein